jgi:hypothetical protein
MARAGSVEKEAAVATKPAETRAKATAHTRRALVRMPLPLISPALPDFAGDRTINRAALEAPKNAIRDLMFIPVNR